MTRTLPALACLSVLALAACNREAPVAEPVAEPAAVTAPATDPIAGTAATEVAATPMPSTDAAAAFDKKAFAGVFAQGADRLELRPDGTYLVTIAGSPMEGTWTAEENDTRIRLDPNSKSEADRVFAINGRDELAALDANGQPAAGTSAMTLRREAPPSAP